MSEQSLLDVIVILNFLASQPCFDEENDDQEEEDDPEGDDDCGPFDRDLPSQEDHQASHGAQGLNVKVFSVKIKNTNEL